MAGNLITDPYDWLNRQLSLIPGFQNPRYIGGGQVDPSVAQQGLPPEGQLAYKNGEEVYYVNPYYGFQSPEGFKKATGKYPKGFQPPTQGAPTASAPPVVTEPPADSPDPDTGASSSSAASSPDRAPSAPAPGSVGQGATVPQTQEPVTKETLDLLREFMDPAYQQELSQQKTANLVKAATVLSALREPRERQKQQAEIERQNIQAWRDTRVAQINANAQQGAALSLAIASSMAPNLGNFGEIFKATASQMAARPRG